MNAKHKARTLSRQLLPLHPRTLEPAALAQITGGELASTSTSGTPAAGDDTEGDALGGCPHVQVLSARLD